MIDQCVKVLKQHNAVEGARLEEKTLTIIQKRPGHEEVNEIQKSGYIAGKLNGTLAQDKVEAITKIFEEKDIEVDLNF